MLEILPEDILIIILKKLDFKSQINLYEALECVKRIFNEYKIIKECNISLNTIATVKTLETHFFRIIAPNLLKLDLSAVNDLSKTSLMPSMVRLKHLETLDVSYTKVHLNDFINIYKVCPTIKNVTIQFYFGPKCGIRIPMHTILECQKIFRNFDSIHFYGNRYNLMSLSVVPPMLKLSNLKILQYTLTDYVPEIVYNIDYIKNVPLRCNSLCINDKYSYHIAEDKFPFNCLDLNLYEYLLITSCLKYWDACGSPIFNTFFKEKFEAKINNSIGNSTSRYDESSVLMLWSKSSHTFDEVFFYSLHKKLRQFLVSFTLDSWPVNTISNYDIFCITPKEREGSNNNYSNAEFGFKRKRIVAQNHVLDYDEDFRDKAEVQLNLMFSLYMLKTAITLNGNCEYLKKLTYLNLTGAEKYSVTFFNVLFRSCVRLITLNVNIDNLNANDVARSAPLSHSIKNLRIVAKMMDFNSVLTSLSQCSSLENLHIADMSNTSMSKLFDPTTMIQKCAHLYCVHIYNRGLCESNRAKQVKIIEKAKAMFHKPYLRFKVLNKVEDSLRDFSPFVDVFQLLQIKIIKLFYQTYFIVLTYYL